VGPAAGIVPLRQLVSIHAHGHARVILGRDVEHAALLRALVTPVTAERDGVTEIERDERLAAAGLPVDRANVARWQKLVHDVARPRELLRLESRQELEAFGLR